MHTIRIVTASIVAMAWVTAARAQSHEGMHHEGMNHEGMNMDKAAPEVAKDAKDAKDTYPLKTCVVSGEKLGEMGKPVIFKYKGKEIRFCCKDCKKDFLKNPKKYLAKLEKAKKMQAAGMMEHEEGEHSASEAGQEHHEGHEHHDGNGM